MKKSVLRTTVLLGLVLFTAACESIPSGMNSSHWFSFLPADASYYFVIDCNRERELVKNLLKKSPYYSSDTVAIVNNTRRIYISIRTRPGGEAELSFVFLGGYPQFLINSALENNREWDAVKGDHPYWKNKVNGIELAVPSGYCILLSQGSISSMLASWEAMKPREISATIEREIQESDLVVFFPVGIDESTASKLKLNIKRTLIEEVWISGRKKGNRMILTSVIRVSEDINPEAFMKLFKFMMLGILRKEKIDGVASRMKEITFFVEDRSVKMSNFFLTPEEIIGIVGPLLSGKGD